MTETLTQEERIEKCRSWTPAGLVTLYDWLQGGDFSFPAHLYPLAVALSDWRCKNLMITVGPGSGKALHPDTPVLCENGWTPIKNVKVGDKVWRPEGMSLATVTAVQHQEPDFLYRVALVDGREILAHKDHLWKAHHKKMRRWRGYGHKGKGRGQQGERGVDGLLWNVVSTQDIKDRMESAKDLRWFVPLVEPICFDAMDLPIPPYILGCTLGDGYVPVKGPARITSADWEIGCDLQIEAETTELKVHRTSDNTCGCPNWSIGGSGPLLAELGLDHKRSWEKFVPEIYKRASYDQRLSLIQGLLDTDGTISKIGHITYTTTSYQLAKDVQELIWSLGGIAKVSPKQTYFTHKGVRKAGRPSFTVNIRFRDSVRLFRLPRKQNRVGAEQYSATLKLRIISIEKEPTRSPSVCISLDSPDGLYVVKDYVVTHNSTLLSQVFAGAVLGRNPSENIICVSGAEQLAIGFQNVVQAYVADNPGFHACFPNVKPDRQRGWSSTAGMFVTGHRASSPDASYWSAGLGSKTITGKHGTILIFDDIHTEENSSNEAQCLQVVETYVRQLIGRADPRGARYLVAGRRWHEKDLYGQLKDNGDWVVLTLPYERPGSKLLWYDITVPESLDCVFTDGLCQSPDGDLFVGYEQMPKKLKTVIERKENGVVLKHMEWPYGIDERGEGFFWPEMESKRKEYFSAKRLNPSATMAVYQCDPSARHGSVFLESDFDRRYIPFVGEGENRYQITPEEMELGTNSKAVAAFCRQNGAVCAQSWDTAFSSSSTSDYSVCVTALLVPCEHYHRGEDETVFGPCERHFDIYVLNVWRGKVDYAGVERQMRAMYQMWQPAIIAIENRAYGVSAIENLQNSGLPVVSINPSSLESKRARAVEGVSGGSVQGWCRSWRVCLPDEAEWLEKFVKEMTGFTGAKGGTDDQVDALVHLARWAIQNGGGADLPSEWGDSGKVDAVMRQDVQPDNMANFIAGVQSLAFDPFGECCGRCRHFVGLARDKKLSTNRDLGKLPRDYCLLHDRRTQAIGSCDDHMSPDDNISHPFWGTN